MDTLKKLFPQAFRVSDVASMVVAILIYIVVAIIGGLVIGLAGVLTGWIPLIGALVGVLCRAVGAVVDLYALAGIVIAILVYCKVLK